MRANSNPLQAVMGAIDFLKDTFAPDDERVEDVQAILTGTADMKRVLDDISEWVKVSVGQLELKPEPTSLMPLLQSTVR